MLAEGASRAKALRWEELGGLQECKRQVQLGLRSPDIEEGRERQRPGIAGVFPVMGTFWGRKVI